jgi:hypothetical protein
MLYDIMHFADINCNIKVKSVKNPNSQSNKKITAKTSNNKNKQAK